MIEDDNLQFYYRYRSRNGTGLTVTFDTVHAVKVSLNNKPEMMELSEPASMENFRQLTEPEVKQLSTLHINGPVTDELLSERLNQLVSDIQKVIKIQCKLFPLGTFRLLFSHFR